MSSELAVRRSQTPAPTYYRNGKLSRQVLHDMQNMQAAVDVANAATDAISRNHSYADFKVGMTMNNSDLLQQLRRDRGASQVEEAAYQRRTQQYLNAVSHVAAIVDTKIILNVQQFSLPDGNDTGDTLLERLDAFFKS